MAVTTTKINRPINPRANDQSPKGYNRASLFSGKALDFDGTNDSLSVGTLSGDVYAATFYTFTDSDITKTTSTQTLINFATGSGNWAFKFGASTGFLTDETFSILLPNSARVGIDKTIPKGWNAWAVCWDGSTYKIYQNGQEQQTITSGTASVISMGLVELGKEGSGQYYNGSLSNVKVYSTALTAAQVADLYNNPEKIVPTGVADSALKLWLPMQEGAGTTAYDGSGNGNHGAVSGASWLHGIGAPVSQTAVMDWNKYSITDTTDYANVSSTTIASEGTIVFKHVPLADVGNTYFFSYGTALTGQSRSIRQYLGNYEFIGWGSPNVNDKATSEALEVGVIKNVAYSWDASGNVKVYIDGSNVLDASLTLNTLTSSKVGVNIAPTHASQMSNQIMFYAGLYDEVLTESQIQDIHDGTTNPESVSGLVHFWRNSNDWQDEVGSADLTENDNAGKVLFPQTLTTGRDLAGNIFANVRKQGALNLDGNSWAEVHDNASLDMTTTATMEAWVNGDNLNNSYDIIMVKSSATYWTGNYGRYTLRAKEGTVNWWFDDFTANAKYYSVALSGWNHLAVTKDGTEEKLYVNGALVSTQTGAATFTASPYSLLIGVNSSKTENWTKPIAQPRIYNRALTAEEVERNYTAGKYIYTND